MELLFLLSQQLEKLQRLSVDELEELLEKVEEVGGRRQEVVVRCQVSGVSCPRSVPSYLLPPTSYLL